MPTPLTTVASDRSSRWILVPGVSSTRQIEIRNDSDAPVEAHLRVEQPATASVSPGVMTIPPRHSRMADVVFLATWSPTEGHQMVVSYADVQGRNLGEFAQELVAADNADCTISLDLKDDIVVDQALLAFSLWCTVVSRSSTPRRFEVNLTPHPALRLPERKTVTLGPGESAAFEVPVQWNRAVRDLAGWNHPRSIEVYVPVTEGRRSVVLPWDQIEQRFFQHLSVEDRQAKIVVAPPEPSLPKKTPGQLKYEELVELKRLEQGVVAATARPVAKADEARAQPGRRAMLPTLVTITFALVALVLAGFFFWRPPLRQPSGGPVAVGPPLRANAGLLSRLIPAKAHAKTVQRATAVPAWTSVAATTRKPNTVTTAPVVSQPMATPVTVAAAARPEARTEAPVDRNQVVTLLGVDAAYASAGHAVSVTWSANAQASALVQVVDFTGKVIASRTVHGEAAEAVLRLPKGYHGSLSVNVTAYGYHGERVVQSASLGSAE